jgi:crotonobetainyl-CoA:carnitine CoA-transferase CaiB-like acyl-CoA transferase
MSGQAAQPLSGIKVLEFSHMVMGPVVGGILAELGADVIKVEPRGGDATRELPGSGAGYFPMYNRNKKSICLNLKDSRGLSLARRLALRSDVLIENFRPGVLDGLGLSHESLEREHPRLIYCSLKGFLAGPYAHRTALDEVAQMMGGLAYMTGPPGRPLRAGASVIDVTGGMFGVIGILAALEQRHSTGRGQKITSALFETTVYLVGQHMAQLAVTGQAAKPMPVRVSAWAIYDVFEVLHGEQVFVAVVSDSQWQAFCAALGFLALAADPRYATNRQRVLARDVLLPMVREHLATFTKADLLANRTSRGPVRRSALAGRRRPCRDHAARRTHHAFADSAVRIGGWATRRRALAARRRRAHRRRPRGPRRERRGIGHTGVRACHLATIHCVARSSAANSSSPRDCTT